MLFSHWKCATSTLLSSDSVRVLLWFRSALETSSLGDGIHKGKWIRNKKVPTFSLHNIPIVSSSSIKCRLVLFIHWITEFQLNCLIEIANNRSPSIDMVYFWSFFSFSFICPCFKEYSISQFLLFLYMKVFRGLPFFIRLCTWSCSLLISSVVKFFIFKN